MRELPALTTARLVLRPFALADAGDVQRLAGDPAIAATTVNIPHPYEDGVAEQWIATQQADFGRGDAAHFAITLRRDGSLTGAVSLLAIAKGHRAELGYWVGKPFWNQGICTEAGRRVIEFGFSELGLLRIHAQHMTRNPASGRVMEKLGMRREGCLRQHLRKDDRLEDVIVYGILKEDWLKSRGA